MVSAEHDNRDQNRVTLRKLAIVAAGMFAFGFAMVPFYRTFCEVVGINNIAKADTLSNSQVDAARWITMEFDTNVRSDLPWTFQPVDKSVRFHPGELVQVTFEVRNTADRAITGQAVPSWGPQVAGRHMKKLDCFCFRQQTLQPGEVRRMPVVFVVEKTLPEDVNYVTMSYTFFHVEGRTNTSRNGFHVEGRTNTSRNGFHLEGRTNTSRNGFHVEGRTNAVEGRAG